MATLQQCDRCKRVDVPTVSVTITEESPHNGDLYETDRDFCVYCLRKATNIKATFDEKHIGERG